MYHELLQTAHYPEIFYESPPVSLANMADMLYLAKHGEPDAAWRLAESAGQCTDRLVREYASTIWGLLAEPDRLQHPSWFPSPEER